MTSELWELQRTKNENLSMVMELMDIQQQLFEEHIKAIQAIMGLSYEDAYVSALKIWPLVTSV